MRCIPRYFCSTKSSKRPSTALINHTINQNSIQLSAQTPSKISASLIIKFRHRLSLLARGRGAAWHWDEGQAGIATPGAWERLNQPSPPTPQHPSTATSSKAGIAAHDNTSHCFPLFCSFHTASLLFLIYFKLFLCLCIISTFPCAHLLSSHPFTLYHRLPSVSLLSPSSSLPTPPSKRGNRNPKEEQELNLCQHNGPRGYIWNQQITEPWRMLVI